MWGIGHRGSNACVEGIITCKSKDKDLASKVGSYWSASPTLKLQGRNQRCGQWQATLKLQSFAPTVMSKVYFTRVSDHLVDPGNCERNMPLFLFVVERNFWNQICKISSEISVVKKVIIFHCCHKLVQASKRQKKVSVDSIRAPFYFWVAVYICFEREKTRNRKSCTFWWSTCITWSHLMPKSTSSQAVIG